MSSRLLVTGSEYPAGLAGLRALSRAGFETWAAVSARDALGARSRAAAGIVDVPDPRLEADAFVAVLADAALRLGVDAVLPGSEAALLAIAGREDAFPPGVAVGSAPVTAVRRALDKTALALLSLRAGMDVPPTRVVAAGDPADVTFPAMVKPLRSELVTAGQLQRFEARRVESAADMDAALRELPDEVGLVQPYFDGRLISVNGVGFDGELYAVNQHVVHRVWPPLAGGAVYAETIPMTPERRRTTATLVRELGWSGVFNLQLIERDGRELRDRPEPALLRVAVAGGRGRAQPAGVSGRRWCWACRCPRRMKYPASASATRHDRDDLRAVLHDMRAGGFAAARELVPRRHTVHALFSARDPRPGLTIAEDAARALRRRSRPSSARCPPRRP